MNKQEPGTLRTNSMAPSPEYRRRFWSEVLLSLAAILCALVMVYLMSRQAQLLLLLALAIISALLGIASTRRFLALAGYFQQLREKTLTASDKQKDE
jgi:hypothetical protein